MPLDIKAIVGYPVTFKPGTRQGHDGTQQPLGGP